MAFLLAFLLQYDDERVFHAAGQAQLYGLYSWDGGRGYYHLINLLYALFGPNLLVPKLLNCFWGALLPFVIYDIVWRLFGSPKAAWCSCLVSAFSPPLVIYSAVNLKEITTAFLLVITVWFMIAGRNKLLVKVGGGTVAIAGLYLLRGAYWAVVPLAGLVVSVLLGESWRLREMATAQWIGKFLLIVLGTIMLGPALWTPISGTIEQRLSPESYYAERFEGSSATVMQVVDASNSLSGSNLVILFVRGLYTPSPLRFIFDYGIGVGTLIEASVGLVWYLTFPFAVAGFIAERHKGAVLACGVMMVIVLIMSGLSVMFGSNPYRHRMAAMGLVFVLGGVGCQNEIRKAYQWVFHLWWAGAMIFTLAWFVFRV
jgi:4-amino-4-deoxy-L-arabinose transferase-like glycosyltransferase